MRGMSPCPTHTATEAWPQEKAPIPYPWKTGLLDTPYGPRRATDARGLAVGALLGLAQTRPRRR